MLAVIDTLVLYNGLLRIWIVELIGIDYQESGNWICKLTVSIGYVSSDLSVWLIIAVTVERYLNCSCIFGFLFLVTLPSVLFDTIVCCVVFVIVLGDVRGPYIFALALCS